MTRATRRSFLLSSGSLLALGALFGAPALAANQDEALWNDLRETLFEDRAILPGDGVIDLDAPYRAHDAAVVPISMVALMPQTSERYIKAMTLIIDKNPAPVAAVFELTPQSGLATISTRVRVDSYTHMRVIAETNDGQLYMTTKFVKAAGGCSAPALKNEEEAIARLGKMKLRQSQPARLGEPNEVQLLISHPNYSGLQRDMLTNYYIPAHFVREVVVSYGGQPVLKMEGAISISEDPSLRFTFVPEGPGELTVEAWDTDDTQFTQGWPIDPKAGS
ncbi:MAG: quinoprotein dehydrogenase-associated SoxYZ-like carrier [Pseudomonadota bacterium]